MDIFDTPAMRAWPRLAAAAGLDLDQRPRPLRRGGAVVRMGNVVLKHAPGAFGRIVRAHRQAARVLRDDPLNHAPAFMGFDEVEQILLLAFTPGIPMRDLVAEGVAAEDLLTLTGRWLRAFHDGRQRDIHPFDARAATRRIAQKADFLPEAFSRARADLARRADALQGTPQSRAVLHGDLNASNLLVNRDKVTGVDFENLGLHPAMRDAGQIIAELHLRAAQPPRQVLPMLWRSAFEAAYGTGGDMLEFFVRQRLLRQWATVPAREGDRGAARQAMALAIEKFAEAFAAPG